MSSDQMMELYRQLRTSQDKYAYFLLASVGASIAFALSQTRDLSLSLSQCPLGLAVLLWGLSFYFGCRHIQYVSSTLYANAELLKVEGGRHPEIGRHPQMMAAASEGIRSAIETNINRSGRLANLQFSFFVTGVIFYVVWHILEMYLRVHT